MKSESKGIKLVIAGEQYTLASDESEHHLQLVAQMVDGMLKDLSGKAPYASEHKLAILAAMQCASQMVHAKELASAYQHQLELLTHQISKDLELIDRPESMIEDHRY